VKVPARSLHLRESAAPTTAMRLLKAVTCSIGSPLALKVARWGGLKLSGIGAFQISANKVAVLARWVPRVEIWLSPTSVVAGWSRPKPIGLRSVRSTG